MPYESINQFQAANWVLKNESYVNIIQGGDWQSVMTLVEVILKDLGYEFLRLCKTCSLTPGLWAKFH
jgi:hypothetical protein